MRIFRYNSPLMTFLSRLADLIILNILWIVCCLPLITAGAATTALYSCVLNMDEKDEQPVFRRYFTAFSTSFWKSTAIFAVWVVLIAFVLLNLWFYLYLLQDIDGWFRIIPMIPAALLLMFSSYLFPLHARFENSIPRLLKNAFSLTVVHLPTTAVITFVNCFPLLLLYFKTDIFLRLLAVWTLFGFALLAYLNAFLIKKVFCVHLPKTETEEEKNEKDI